MTEPGPSGPDPDRAQRSIQALERGQLPLEAEARIERHRKGGAWTSDLSVEELAAIHSVGFVPVGQVMGSSVYKIGWSGYYSCGYGWGFTATELTPYAEALHAARGLAITRLREEARELGAHGVTGVRLRFRTFEDAPGAVEFTAVGTAITAPAKDAPPQPFTSGLDGQGFAKLMRAGFVPASLVLGVSAMFIHTGWAARSAQMSWNNVEVADFSHAMTETRRLGMSRLYAEALQHGGDGTVASETQLQVFPVPCTSQREGEDHVVVFVAMATAVVRFPTHEPPEPVLQVRLIDQEV